MYTKNFYNKNLKIPGRELRNNMTPAENKLWYQFLNKFKPGARRQRSLGNFIADFYIPKAKLVIEIDGDVHSDEKAISKDIDRTMALNQSGIEVIRFKNEEVIKDFSSVCNKITQEVSLRMKISITGNPLF